MCFLVDGCRSVVSVQEEDSNVIAVDRLDRGRWRWIAHLLLKLY